MRLAYDEKQNDSMDNITLFLMVLNFECTVYVLYQNHQLLSFSVFVLIGFYTVKRGKTVSFQEFYNLSLIF